MGMDRKNATGKWQQRGNCGSAAEGRRGSRDNRQDADIPNATLVLVIPIQLSFSNPGLLRLMGIFGEKKSYSHRRSPV